MEAEEAEAIREAGYFLDLYKDPKSSYIEKRLSVLKLKQLKIKIEGLLTGEESGKLN